MGVLGIIGLILFVGLVIVHEIGHYKAAKRGGIEVEEFGVFFPPKIWGKKLKNKTLLTLNLIPLGGFVRLKGEHDSDKAKGSYGAAPLKTKVKVLLAGVVMNLLVALGIFTILAWVGMPRLFDDQFTVASDTEIIRQDVLVGYVEPDSPAANAGIEQRDQIVGIGSTAEEIVPITDINNFPEQTKQLAGETIVVSVKQNGETVDKSVTLRDDEQVEQLKSEGKPAGYLGIAPSEYILERSTWSAPIKAVGLSGQFSWLTLKGIGAALVDVFSGNPSEAADQVSGPVGIFVLIKNGSLLGFQFILMIIAVISLTLALMNALPIPALDGGKLYTTLIYRALGKELTPKAESIIYGTGFVVLLAIIVLATIADAGRF